MIFRWAFYAKWPDFAKNSTKVGSEKRICAMNDNDKRYFLTGLVV